MLKIGPYSKKALFIGIVGGFIITVLSVFVIYYTDQLFLVTTFWLVSIPFFLWIIKKLRRAIDPDSETGVDDGLEDGGSSD